MTFHVDAPIEGAFETRKVALAGLELEVFTHSFLGFGQDSAQNLALRLAASQLKLAEPAAAEQVHFWSFQPHGPQAMCCSFSQ